jgi:lipopolysaccharide transport system ATP-binding protein
MTPVIQFTQVSKRYLLQRQPRMFREAFVQLSRRPTPTNGREHWAVRDVSFNIRAGEAVGLIGPNGAGKSTALKLISQIIPATRGIVTVQGRVAALLELGTGFHPELSGRENVFLSGALVGMGRAEMNRKFDSIVDFSELERFIDEPVKHYSSGMFARLAFAVSIHLEPEILLVDEVLSVGDQSFQQKCLDRIAQMRREGITMCFVSHAAEAVRALCTRALWFEQGRLVADGHAESVVRQYIDAQNAVEAERLAQEVKRAQATHAAEASPAPAPITEANAGVIEAAPGNATSLPRWGSRKITLERVYLLNEQGQETTLFETGQSITLVMEYWAHTAVPAPIFGMALHRQDGVHVCGPNTDHAGLKLPTLQGRGQVRYNIARFPLLEGLYHLSVAVVNETDTETFDYHDHAYSFRVMTSAQAPERYGLLSIGGQWQFEA